MPLERVPRRVLFVCHPNIGDAVNLTAAARWMKTAWPTAHVTVATSALAAPVFLSSEFVDDIVSRPQGAFQKVAFVHAVRQRRFDLAVFAYPQRTLLRLVRIAGIATIAGIREREDEPWDEWVPERSEGVKVPGEVADLLTGLGCDCRDWTPSVVPSSDDIEAVDRLGLPEKCVAINVGASHPNKTWGVDRFVELGRRLRANGRSVAYVGGLAEREALASFDLGDATVVAGSLSVMESAELLRRCRLLVTSDSGPSHLAAAMGTPVVGLYGPTWVEKHRPFGDGHVLLQGQCPCPVKSVDRCTGDCWSSLSVDSVEKAVQDLLQLGD